MRVMEATQVYRARLAGGSAPITLAADLKRGAYGYHLQAYTPLQASTAPAPAPPEPLRVSASAGR
jgi:soluble lytic murein transglycosylase